MNPPRQPVEQPPGYVHIYELHPAFETRTCRRCGETKWFHSSVSDRWPHWDCDDRDGFSKPEAIPA